MARGEAEDACNRHCCLVSLSCLSSMAGTGNEPFASVLGDVFKVDASYEKDGKHEIGVSFFGDQS